MKRRLFLFPIEPLEERYSAQWYRWFSSEPLASRFDLHVVDGEQTSARIETGEFLDVFDTNVWKATQLARWTKSVRETGLRSTDVVLFLDAWSPTVEQVAYIRDLTGTKFRMVGLLHAGTWDPHDFITKAGMGSWATDCERGWLRALDAACVATYFHRDLICRTHPDAKEKIAVTGFPLLRSEWQQYAQPWDNREDLVVFPHRLAAEKQPEVWERFVEACRRDPEARGVSFVRTKDVCASKEAYYHLLGRARVAVSFALQETWGIAMLEAASLGCWPVTPARLSYREVFWQTPHFTSVDEAAAQTMRCLRETRPFLYDGSGWEDALKRIADVCEGC